MFFLYKMTNMKPNQSFRQEGDISIALERENITAQMMAEDQVKMRAIMRLIL